MSVRGHLALLLFVTCLSQLIVTAESVKGAGRKEKKQESRGDNTLPIRARFRTKDKAKCALVARGEDTYILTVTCKPEKGDKFTCKYTARPASCPAFVTNPKTYWEQISRSLIRQKKPCADPRSVLRAGMCKNAPQEAHFKFTQTASEKSSTKEKKEMTTNATTPDTRRKCAQNSDHSKIAKEKCGDSWASLCTFFFTLVQSEEC